MKFTLLILSGIALIVFFRDYKLIPEYFVEHHLEEDVTVIKKTKKDLPVKRIIVAENYDINDGQSSLDFHKYSKKIAEIAVKRIMKKELMFRPEFSVSGTDGTLDRFDPERIWKLVDFAKSKDAIAVIGFGWSTMAAIASRKTNQYEIPFISPTAVVKEVFHGSYSKSLGLAVWDAAKGFKKLYEKLEKPPILTIQNLSKIQEVEYVQEVNKILSNNELLNYDSIFPTEQAAMLAEKLGKNTVIFIPGYSDLAEYLFEISKRNKDVRFIVGPQWPDESEVLSGLKNDVFCISDFSTLITGSEEFNFLKSELDKEGMEIPCIFFLKIYDAMLIVLNAINKCPDCNRSDLMKNINNLGHFSGSSGEYFLEDGIIKKEAFINANR